MEGWIGVDLDGTLAEYHGWQGIDHIGKPIPAMVKRIDNWLREGITVKIFTARASEESARPYIEAWLEEHDLAGLEITNVKDFGMICLYDDRCVQVESNTGRLIGELK